LGNRNQTGKPRHGREIKEWRQCEVDHERNTEMADAKLLSVLKEVLRCERFEQQNWQRRD